MSATVPSSGRTSETEPFIAAAVQAAPVFLDAEATAKKAVALIAEAAAEGAKLIAFPEVFIPGYPYWNWIVSPLEGSAWFHRLHDASVSATGPEVRQIAEAAKQFGVHVVIGINERSEIGVGTIFNTLLTINDQGHLIGRHRKLVPTWAEKLTWTGGDGSSLVVHDTSVGPLGALHGRGHPNPFRGALLRGKALQHHRLLGAVARDHRSDGGHCSIVRSDVLPQTRGVERNHRSRWSADWRPCHRC